MIDAKDVNLRPHETTKVVFGKTIKKSFGQDFVDMKGDDGIWRHVGYYSYSTNTFSGLVNWDNSLNDAMAKAIAAKKGVKVQASEAPQDKKPEQPEESEFEYDTEG